MKHIKTALLFSFLLISVLTQEFEDPLELLQKMETTSFGQTLLDTIDLQLSTGDSVDTLLKLLSSMEASLQKDQKEDDDSIHCVQEECQNSLEKLRSEINLAKTRSSELKEILDDKIPIKNNRQQTLKDKEEFQQLILERTSDLDNKKQDRDAQWESTQQQHEQARFAIQKAMEILQGSVKAFVEVSKSGVSSSFAELSEHFKAQKFQKKSWNSIFSLLAQITATAPVQADQGKVNTVLDLCKKLLAKVGESLDLERKDYRNYIDEYTNARAGLVEKLKNVVDSIQALQIEINTLNKQINNAQAEKKDQDDRADQKQRESRQKEKLCDDEVDEYAKRREERDANRQTISQTIGLINQKLRILKKYLADRKSRSSSF